MRYITLKVSPLLMLLFALALPACDKPDAERASPPQNNVALSPLETYLLPVIQGEYAGRTAVSAKEEADLTQEQDRNGFALLRQPAFPGIEDRVVAYVSAESWPGEGCEMDEREVMLSMDLPPWDNGIPEACYRRYVSYKHYPQNTGSAEVDRVIAGWHKKYHSYAESGYANEALPGLGTYLIGRPSPRYLSVAFSHQAYPWGRHDAQYWGMHNFDLETGSPLTLEDVFPDIKRSETLLWKYPLWSLAAEPPFIRSESLEIATNRLFLAQDGLYIVYNMYELGRSGGDGLLVGYVPLADLAGLGANTALWGK